LFADQLEAVVTRILNRMATLRSGVRRPPKSATCWLFLETFEAKRYRRHHKRRCLSSCDDNDRAAYRRASRANKLINESRSQFYNHGLQDCADDPRGRWHNVKELLHTSDPDGTRTDDENSQLCQTFSTYFMSKISLIKNNNN
jgi:hypothetical protein